MPGFGLAPGSWWSALILCDFSLAPVRRTVLEDRLPRERLDGYAEYAVRARWRWVRGVW